MIGHRGASGAYPENTLSAFRAAIDEGADGIELDVRGSRDGVPVVIHDPTVDRTTNGEGAVSDFSLDDLRTLDAGGGERIPTLAEVLEAHPTTAAIVEVKEARTAHAALEVLRRSNAKERVLVGSFLHSVMDVFADTEFARASSRLEATVFFVASRLRLPLSNNFQAFCIPPKRGAIGVVDDRFLRCAGRVGLPVHLWTVDDPNEARKFWSQGVSGIITNHPARMVEARNTK
ncbi:MAG: glycerophosphodiester phosphodiesterase [Gemmatimonadales bacterium]